MSTAAAHSSLEGLAPARVKASGSRLRTAARLRFVVQVATLLLVLAPLWWPAVLHSRSIYQGNFAASRLQLGPWSVPLADPFTTLTLFAASGQVPLPLVWGAMLVLGVYLLVRGRAFCAYACPIHLVLEVVDRLVVRLGLRRDGIGEAAHPGSNVAMAVLLLIGSACVGAPIFEPVNPINMLVRSLQHWTFAGLWVVAAVLIFEAATGRRRFCRQVCPVGGFYSVVNRLGAVGLAVDPAGCTGCQKCTVFCLAAPELSAAIRSARQPEAKSAVRVESRHCTLCLECASACEHQSMVVVNRWNRRSAPPSSPSFPS